MKIYLYYSNSLKKIQSEINLPIYIIFHSDIQKANCTSAELRKFFENENWNASFLDYPYFHWPHNSSNQLSGEKIKLNDIGNKAYLFDKRYFIEWKITREINSLRNGKSKIEEIWILKSLNVASQILMKLFKKTIKLKVEELAKKRNRMIYSRLSGLTHFPAKIHLPGFTEPDNFFVESSIQNVFILPFFYNWKNLKKYHPKHFTPRFYGDRVLLYCISYQIRSLVIQYSTGKECTEHFQKILPIKSDIYAECFPYSDEKIVELEIFPIKIGSVYGQKGLLEKEINWNFSPNEIRELMIHIEVTKKNIILKVGNCSFPYKQNGINKCRESFQEFGIKNRFNHKTINLLNSNDSTSGFFLSSATLSEWKNP